MKETAELLGDLLGSALSVASNDDDVSRVL